MSSEKWNETEQRHKTFQPVGPVCRKAQWLKIMWKVYRTKKKKARETEDRTRGTCFRIHFGR